MLVRGSSVGLRDADATHHKGVVQAGARFVGIAVLKLHVVAGAEPLDFSDVVCHDHQALGLTFNPSLDVCDFTLHLRQLLFYLFQSFQNDIQVGIHTRLRAVLAVRPVLHCQHRVTPLTQTAAGFASE
jgi:hypothetical protein